MFMSISVSILFCVFAIMAPAGTIAAMDAFAEGRLSLVYIGDPPPVDYRDSETGILLESLGCESDSETERFRDSWNDFVLYQWSYLSSDSTFFVIRNAAESLEYRECVLVYRDAGGSVPIDIFPEELASLAATSRYSLRDSFENIVYLEMYTPIWDDTLKTELPLRNPVVVSLLERGRREIRRNQIIE